MKLPQIILNAKVYPQVATLAGNRSLFDACAKAAQAHDTIIGLAPPQVFLGAVAQNRSPHVALFAQHSDALAPGSGTGHTTVESLAGMKLAGSLLNHAEHKIDHELVRQTTSRLQDAGLQSLVCADGDAEVAALAPLEPTYMAVEPPELIGGDISVTTADPGIVERNAAAISKLAPATAPLCGAGVKTGEDVATALRLGCHGVLLASGVVKAADPTAALLDLCNGLG